MEVRLLHAPARDRHASFQHREPPGDAALHLRLDRVRVHVRSAVARAPDAQHAEASVAAHADLGYFRDERAVRFGHRDAEPGAGRHRAAPARCFRRGFEDALVPRLLLQERAAELERILARGVGQLVHEALEDEPVLRVADRSPEADRDARVMHHVFDAHVRDRVREVGQALDRRRIDAVLHVLRDHARHDRRPDDARPERHRLLVAIERRRELRVRRGAVLVVLHVVGARPHDHDRSGDSLADLHRFQNEVRLRAPAEAAAAEGRVHADFLRREPGDLGRRGLRERLELRGNVDVAAVGAHVGRAIHRFHRGVRHERDLVLRFDALRGLRERLLGVAVVARDRAGRLGQLEVALADRFVGNARVGALAPRDG